MAISPIRKPNHGGSRQPFGHGPTPHGQSGSHNRQEGSRKWDWRPVDTPAPAPPPSRTPIADGLGTGVGVEYSRPGEYPQQEWGESHSLLEETFTRWLGEKFELHGGCRAGPAEMTLRHFRRVPMRFRERPGSPGPGRSGGHRPDEPPKNRRPAHYCPPPCLRLRAPLMTAVLPEGSGDAAYDDGSHRRAGQGSWVGRGPVRCFWVSVPVGPSFPILSPWNLRAGSESPVILP